MSASISNGHVGRKKQINRLVAEPGGEHSSGPDPGATFANNFDSDVAPVVSDYPTPAVFSDGHAFIWNADQPATSMYAKFAKQLQQVGDLYRLPAYASGLLLASPCALIPPTEITKGCELAAIRQSCDHHQFPLVP